MSVEIQNGWLSGSLLDDTGREWPIKQFRQVSYRGPLKEGRVPNLIVHTTETPGYVESLRYPSQWQCGEGVIGQHIRLGYSGDSVNTWDQYAQQIELVGYSKLYRWLPVENTLGPAVALTAWLHRSGLIKTGVKRPAPWPVVLDQGPQASLDYYRRHAGLWPDTPGVYGHVDIPDNKHWDPGSFDYPKFFERVKNAIAVQEGDVADERFTLFLEGIRARRAGQTKDPDWDNIKKLGYELYDDGVEFPKTTAHAHVDYAPATHTHPAEDHTHTVSGTAS